MGQLYVTVIKNLLGSRYLKHTFTLLEAILLPNYLELAIK